MNEKKTSASPVAASLIDPFSRSISYLRLSLTDRCNLRCMYCIGREEKEQGTKKLAHAELLSYEELLRFVRVAVELGIRKVRLTGGEPLLRRGVLDFIGQLRSIEGLDDIRLTTNGVLLADMAEALFRAGVNKLNISLDSLKRERFARITGGDYFAQVWRGVEAALKQGFSPVKLNMVVMRGVNDDELIDFARLSQQMPLQVRFIEYMPIGPQPGWRANSYVESAAITAQISRLGDLIPIPRAHNDGPAQVFRLGTEAVGSIGFISPVSRHFCDHCNRLRLTSTGALRSCLLHDEELDLRPALRQSADDEAIKEAIRQAIRNKPQGHQLKERLRQSGGDCHGRMSRIGG